MCPEAVVRGLSKMKIGPFKRQGLQATVIQGDGEIKCIKFLKVVLSDGTTYKNSDLNTDGTEKLFQIIHRNFEKLLRQTF